MTRAPNRFLWVFALLPFGVARAQADPRADQRTLSRTIDSWVTNTELNIVPLAEAMPEAKYGFAPTTGEFTGVRTFGDQVKHLAANNDWEAALILGETVTPDMSNETGPDSVRTKAEIVDYLKRSFAHLHRAAAVIDDRNALTPVGGHVMDNAWQHSRLSFAVDAIAHAFDHYGQMVEYVRMNGIVPPASRKKS
jgi:hypothetical protein